MAVALAGCGAPSPRSPNVASRAAATAPTELEPNDPLAGAREEICVELEGLAIVVSVPQGSSVRPGDLRCRLVPGDGEEGDAPENDLWLDVIPFAADPELGELVITEGLGDAVTEWADVERLDAAEVTPTMVFARYAGVPPIQGANRRGVTVIHTALGGGLGIVIQALHPTDGDGAHALALAVARSVTVRDSSDAVAATESLHEDGLPFTAREARAFYQSTEVMSDEERDLFVRAAHAGARAEAAAGAGCEATFAGLAAMDEVINTSEFVQASTPEREAYVRVCEATPLAVRTCMSTIHYLTHYVECDEVRAAISYCAPFVPEDERPELCATLPTPLPSLPVPHGA